jgi:hypothetical protein
MDYSAFQPFSRLIEISLLGSAVRVPENNTLLRGFQFLEPKLPFGPWCWNGDCGSSRVSWRASRDENFRAGLACQIPATEGMEIEKLSPELRRALSEVLKSLAAEPVRTPAQPVPVPTP